MIIPQYVTGGELPNLAITWLDSAGAVRDFSSGWTFTVRIARDGGQPALIQKTTGITGAATAPNITVAWVTGELDALTTGTYQLDVIARLVATSQDMVRSTSLQILAGVAAP